MKAWTYALALGGGGIVGFTLGYFLAKKKFEKEKNEEVEEVREYYHKKYDDLEADKFNHDKEVETKTDDLGPSRTSQKVNYNEIIVNEADILKERISSLEEQMAEQENPEEEKPTKPYLITEDEYLNESDFEKIGLTYYTYDDTLADDMNDPVDIEETISTDVFNQVVESDGDSFVRNPILETDYEIMRVEGSYGDRFYR